MYDRLLAQLAQCEFAVTKSDFATKMMKQELKNYETISDTIEGSIEVAKREIEASKEDLILAKKIRKNRMEYDALAKVINAQPDRKKTTEQLDNLTKELNELEEKKAQLQRKLDTRKNDFLVLMRSIKELQSNLDDSSSDEEGNDEKMSMDDDDEKVFEIYVPTSPVYGGEIIWCEGVSTADSV